MKFGFLILISAFFWSMAVQAAGAEAEDRVSSRVPGLTLASHQSEAHILGLSQKRLAIRIAIAATAGGLVGYVAEESIFGLVTGALVVTAIDFLQIVVEAGLAGEMVESRAAKDMMARRARAPRMRMPKLKLAAATNG